MSANHWSAKIRSPKRQSAKGRVDELSITPIERSTIDTIVGLVDAFRFKYSSEKDYIPLYN